MIRRNFFKTLFGTIAVTVVPFPAIVPKVIPTVVVDDRLPKMLIPMIKRVFPEIISSEIVSVQPMSGPVGKVFPFRYEYESVGIAKKLREYSR